MIKYDIDNFLDIDNQNIEQSKKALISVFPESFILVNKITDFFNEISELWGKECNYDKHQKIVTKWAENYEVKGNDILEFLRSAKLIGTSKTGDKTKETQESLDYAQTILARSILLMRLQRDFLFGLSDILKLRITSAIMYLRLQAETSGLIKLMYDHNNIAKAWFSAHSLDQGKLFYRKWHKKIKDEIENLNMNEEYELSSGFSLHSRVGGIAKGIILGNKNNKPGELKLVFQETDAVEDLYFWFGYYLRSHRKIVNQFEYLFPELKRVKIISGNILEIIKMEDKSWNIAKKFQKTFKSFKGA